MKKILFLLAVFICSSSFAQGITYSLNPEGELVVAMPASEDLSIGCDMLSKTVLVNLAGTDILCDAVIKIFITDSVLDDQINLSQVKKSVFNNLQSVRIKATLGNDTIIGSELNDIIHTGSGNDIVNAGSGKDQVFGESGDDRLYGEAGNDKLTGDSGNDKLYGGAGNDNLSGDSGNDLLDGGSGKDKGSVGSGKDRKKSIENGGTFKIPKLPPGFGF